MSQSQRLWILVIAFLSLVFDGFELGLMPVASLSVSKSLLGDRFTPAAGGDWFAWFTAAMMLGAAVGGIIFGNLGDRYGRTRAMGISILFYSVFASLGALVSSQEEMLLLRFLVGLGVGGLWPNAMSLVAECWPQASRSLVSGTMMAGLNAGIFLLSQFARLWPITPEAWRWLFSFAGLPAILGLVAWGLLPESPQWLATKSRRPRPASPWQSLWSQEHRYRTIVGIVLSSIPMVGAWSASKWMIPWADAVAGSVSATYKAETQGWWAIGAILGSFTGAQLSRWLGVRFSYALISLLTVVLTVTMFLGTEPLQASFHPLVLAQGLFATLFFGWLSVFLPELFPVTVRATGSGLCYNFGRFATAIGVLFAGGLFHLLGGSYPQVGAWCASIYGLGLLAIWFADPSMIRPDTQKPAP
jgi:MFS family permease